MKHKRKHILLKNEIEMIQNILCENVYPRQNYKIELANRLSELKIKWYKGKKTIFILQEIKEQKA
jgi:hypothetical protein